jgi:hypothetical protein
MTKIQHGSGLNRWLIPLADCPSCAGKGYVQGIFHTLACAGCHSSGQVHAITLEPLPIEELVVQLGMTLRRARSQLDGKNPTRCMVDEYQTSNRGGPGGSSYKGD